MKDLAGKTAFVTGAASGIGFGIASALAVAFDRLPDSQHTKIGVRLRFEDVVGDPPGPAKAGASRGRHQQPDMEKPPAIAGGLCGAGG